MIGSILRLSYSMMDVLTSIISIRWVSIKGIPRGIIIIVMLMIFWILIKKSQYSIGS